MADVSPTHALHDPQCDLGHRRHCRGGHGKGISVFPRAPRGESAPPVFPDRTMKIRLRRSRDPWARLRRTGVRLGSRFECQLQAPQHHSGPLRRRLRHDIVRLKEPRRVNRGGLGLGAFRIIKDESHPDFARAVYRPVHDGSVRAVVTQFSRWNRRPHASAPIPQCDCPGVAAERAGFQRGYRGNLH
jgi:hypothetical protein